MTLREHFPIFRHHPELIYLDSAATAHKPDCVIDALTRFYSEDYATVHRAAYRGAVRATEEYHGAREIAREFLHAKKVEEIIFTRGTTDGINLIAKTFPFQSGDEILLSELEHHSNLVPWQMVAKEKKLILKWIKVLPDGSLDLATAPFSNKTKLVSITHASNVTGAITPLDLIVKAARQVGAAVLVDGAQAAPHLEIDVQALDVDFYAFSGHKCYGPTGIGVLYGKEERLLTLEPRDGGGDMIKSVSFDHTVYQDSPLRFEAGTPIIASAIGLGAALRFLQAERKESHTQGLLQLATQHLSSVEGLTILGTSPDKVPLISFTLEGVHPLDLAAFLDNRNIAIRTGHLCAQPLLRLFGHESVARVSFGCYNRPQEIKQLLSGIYDAQELLIQASVD
jgi:cysteine desulfurase/selenocysteine lyase